jgi:hypothetical protein
VWAAATQSQPPASRRHRRAAEREEHLLRDVLGLVPRAQHPGRHADDALVVPAEDLFEVGADVTGRRDGHRHAHLPLVPTPGGADDRAGRRVDGSGGSDH